MIRLAASGQFVMAANRYSAATSTVATREISREDLCLLPVPTEARTCQSGISVSRTTHDLLSHDQRRYRTYRDTHRAMNAALGRVLTAFGYQLAPFGSGGAWLVTGRRSRERRAGQ